MVPDLMAILLLRNKRSQKDWMAVKNKKRLFKKPEIRFAN